MPYYLQNFEGGENESCGLEGLAFGRSLQKEREEPLPLIRDVLARLKGVSRASCDVGHLFLVLIMLGRKRAH